MYLIYIYIYTYIYVYLMIYIYLHPRRVAVFLPFVQKLVSTFQRQFQETSGSSWYLGQKHYHMARSETSRFIKHPVFQPGDSCGMANL